MAAAFSGSPRTESPGPSVVKRTANDEIYLLSYRRAKRLETRKNGP